MDIKKAETKKEYAFCIFVRTCVFEIEQEISPIDDFTESEETAINYIGCVNGMPVATVRYQMIDSHIAKIERMAVLSEYQGQGLGSKLLGYAIDDLKKNPSIKQIKLGAQNHAIPFYESFGFKIFGDEFSDAGIPHHNMILEI